MGIPAGMRLPKSLVITAIMVIVYLLYCATAAASKVFKEWSSSNRHQRQYRFSNSSTHNEPVIRAFPTPAGSAKTQKRLPSIKFGEFSRKMKLQVQEEGSPTCAVCLGEVAQSDVIRKLPVCVHVFHRDCVDGWLDGGHVTCPLCRTMLFNEEETEMSPDNSIDPWMANANPSHYCG